MMIRKILCAIDRAPSSLQALGYAIALARWQTARLTLLEVIDEAPTPELPERRRATVCRMTPGQLSSAILGGF